MTSPIEIARFNMIEQQVRPWNVLDEGVLRVLGELPREAFVPDAYQALAYADIDIPIGTDTCMLPPKVVGRMLQALQVREGDKVLEIGPGTGYVTACLARLGGRVIGVEIDPALAEGARERIEALNLRRVEVRAGDAMAAPVDGGPFDVIAVTGSVPTEEPVPMLAQQLAPGGRLFVIVGEDPVMEARLETRIGSGSDLRREALFETSVPALRNVPQPERFVF
ncbi:MAG: protein-L-isoaspartate O-methyltransferase [Thiohalocapsa sp.]|jgi:protein-L-isoaspartate(D-aspartate) O-methyltransferase|uniref:protein-L-isoaspartate O-methyltransferase family protein n=1 Tax=Thiohalocapsa sp. TaxID=2497641 RepID=UPI0025F25C9E|nr:protein-L-isoaspartate O-methyltransferase [Thiohalocapsa sp.]MCG6942436.1 protein-L-isoaspartate O-methyltransferase [Thiohalocapsa sp.]